MTFEIGDEVIVKKAFGSSLFSKMRVKVGEKGVCTGQSSIEWKGVTHVHYEFVFTSTGGSGSFGNTRSQNIRISESEALQKLVKLGG